MTPNVSRSQVNWHATSNRLFTVGFCAGIALGFLSGYPPVPLPDWRFLAASMTVGLLVFPLMIFAIMRFHVAIGTGIKLEPPRLDRFFFHLSRPLDTFFFAAHLAFWQGLGVLLTSWVCWPHNFILGVSMIVGYYSVLCGIRMTLASCKTRSNQHAT